MMHGAVKDYSVQIRIKNNWFLQKMREAGFDTVADLSRACGVGQSSIGNYINIKNSALTRAGAWRPQLIKISDALKCLPEDLFPPQHVETPLKTNKATVEMTAGDVHQLVQQPQSPDCPLLVGEASTTIEASLTRLSPRLERVVRMRFGLGTEPKTLEEVADWFGVTRERIRQMECKALRQLGEKKGQRKQLRDALETITEQQ